MGHAVVAVILDGPRMLVVERGPAASYCGYWAPLSGRLEAGETQQQALVREVREEVGLDVLPGKKVWECPTDDGSFVLHWWTTRVVGGELRVDGAEVTAARWVSAAEFRALAPTFEGDAPFFERILPMLGGTAEEADPVEDVQTKAGRLAPPRP